MSTLGMTVDGDSSASDEGQSFHRHDGEHLGWVRGTTCQDVDTLDVLSGPHGVETSDRLRVWRTCIVIGFETCAERLRMVCCALGASLIESERDGGLEDMHDPWIE